MSNAKITALIGGQYGSEGKGTIAHHLANEYDYHVRVGGPNAGHSFHHLGRIWKMQCVPCGWTNPDAQLIIGAGAVVDLEHVYKEMTEIAAFDDTIWERVWIDQKALVLDSRHHNIEGGVDGEIHQRIGSTGEGVGAAREARMSRNPGRCDLAIDVHIHGGHPWMQIADTVKMLHTARLRQKSILLEGTQGSGLSLIHGPWPYVTSADTNAAQLAVDAGIPPHTITDVIMVIRSHPIRVAGNSGPLRNETTWEEISKKLGRPVEERTTVTHKIRRVGEWDPELVERAYLLNEPTSIALTFADYINPDDEGITGFDQLSKQTRSFVSYLESYFGPVDFIGTGGDTFKIVDRRAE